MKTKGGQYVILHATKRMEELNREMVLIAKAMNGIKNPKKCHNELQELVNQAVGNRAEHEELQNSINFLIQMESFLPKVDIQTKFARR